MATLAAAGRYSATAYYTAVVVTIVRFVIGRHIKETFTSSSPSELN